MSIDQEFMTFMRERDPFETNCSDGAWFLALEYAAREWRHNHPEEKRDANDLAHYYIGKGYLEENDGPTK